jgi:hypothetical protein
MKQITSHIVDPASNQIKITAMYEPGAGGAYHHYLIEVPDSEDTYIKFQSGPLGEFGFNGITMEALLAIVEDRLVDFQAGSFPCHENAMALEFVRSAIDQLHNRTRNRLERGVEGKNEA